MKDYKKININDYKKLHSKEGKYKIIYHYSNGNVMYEHYLINSNFHREDGPAYIQYYLNGNIWYEQYYINDKFHREDEPAFIEYDKNGNINSEYYWLCNKSFTKKDYYSPGNSGNIRYCKNDGYLGTKI